MSAEIVKKRGRPRKIVPEVGELDLVESAKNVSKSTRAKSTKAVPAKSVPTTKSVKAKSTSTIAKPVPAKAVSTSAKDTAAKSAAAPTRTPASKLAQATSSKPVAKPIASTPTPKTIPESVSKSTDTIPTSAPIAPTPAQATPQPTKPTPITPSTSKILSQVRELSAESTKPKDTPIIASKPPPKVSIPLPIMPAPLSTTPVSAPPSTTTPPKAPAQKIPLAALNSKIVENIAGRAGARPNAKGNALPPNYKPVARKVTMTIVALPIAIVTSYVLYQRFILGQERKVLVQPAPVGNADKSTPAAST